jgi:hypothetical protein
MVNTRVNMLHITRACRDMTRIFFGTQIVLLQADLICSLICSIGQYVLGDVVSYLWYWGHQQCPDAFDTRILPAHGMTARKHTATIIHPHRRQSTLIRSVPKRSSRCDECTSPGTYKSRRRWRRSFALFFQSHTLNIFSRGTKLQCWYHGHTFPRS